MTVSTWLRFEVQRPATGWMQNCFYTVSIE